MTAATAAHTEARDLEGLHAFDFLFGHRWAVRHRRLKQRHVGSDEWTEFSGTSYCEPRLGGLANIEEAAMDIGGLGMALRLFDPATREWSVYWVSSRDGALQPPVRGRFKGPRCELVGPDTDDGRPILARYVWSRTDTAEPRWEQAFSLDDGRTWETNWVMDFRRVE